ncbi:MAG: putative transposase [Planctomycetota bacterium]|jgi:putative transposase
MRVQPPRIGHSGLTTARRRHTPEQILAKLRDADVMLADGRSVAEITKKLETSEQTDHRWRNQ